MTTRVAVNGLGRIGRAYLRSVVESDDVEVVAVNDIADSATLARLLRYDSTFGPLGLDVTDHGDAISVADRKFALTHEREVSSLPWAEYGVEVVIESTGHHLTRDAAAGHLDAGAAKVIISAPGHGVDATIVVGVNDGHYDPGHHHVLSAASCTTNCAAPMAKVLHETFGIVEGFLTTDHAYTNDQNLLDGPHRDPRRARGAAVNIIPTTTGAARAVAEVLPELAGRLDGVALRVPVPDGSLVAFTVLLDRAVQPAEVNAAFEWTATSGPLAGRLRYTTDPIVSTDVIGNPASCVFDSGLTQVSGHSGRLVTVFGWYDNEWGYTARLVELTRLVAAAR